MGEQRIGATLVIRSPMGSGIFVNPVLLVPLHALSAWDRAHRSGAVKGAGLRPIAKGLKAKALFARGPLVNDHLYRHQAAPDAGQTLGVVGLLVQPAMPPLPIGLQVRRLTLPGRRDLNMYARAL